MEGVTFRAVYPQGSKFKKIFQPLTKIYEEMPFYITDEGLKIKSMSSDKNVLIIFDMPAIMFEEFDLTVDKLVIRVSPDEFGKVVKRATRDDAVVLEYERGSMFLTVKFVNKKTAVEREFKVRADEVPEEEEIEELNVDLTVTVKMAPKDLRYIVTDAKMISDEVTLETPNEESLIMRAMDVGKSYEAKLTMGNPLSTISVSSPATAKYSVDHLYDATRAYQAGEDLTLEYGTDLPLRIEMDVEGGAKLIMWIAPRA